MSGSSGVEGSGRFYGPGYVVPPQVFQGAYVVPPQPLLHPIPALSQIVHPVRPPGVSNAYPTSQPESPASHPDTHLYQHQWGQQGAGAPPPDGSVNGLYTTVYPPHSPVPPHVPVTYVQPSPYPYVAPIIPPNPYPPPVVYVPSPQASAMYVPPVTPLPPVSPYPPASPLPDSNSAMSPGSYHGSGSLSKISSQGTNSVGHSARLQGSENGYVVSGAAFPVPQPPSTATVRISGSMQQGICCL